MDRLNALFKEAEDTLRDVSFARTRQHKTRLGQKVFAAFPVYTPMEILHAMDILPLCLHGAGNEIEILHADARFGSFICSIVKSTMELGLSKRLDFVDGMLFTGICDAARNVAFIFKRSFPEQPIIFYHLPQNPESQSAREFLREEYVQLASQLAASTGSPLDETRLVESIRRYNENRELQRRLYQVRRESPDLLRTAELYATVRAGNFIPVEEHNRLLQEVLQLLPQRTPEPRDRIRIVLEGSFCEQPPIDLIKLLDDTGCHILDDDFVLGRRLILEPIPTEGDPLANLAEAYLSQARYTSVCYSGRISKQKQFMENIRRYTPEALIFMYAKFCEPGLFDYVLFKRELETAGMPYLFIEFEEKMWNFDRMRLEIETFLESLIFA